MKRLLTLRAATGFVIGLAILGCVVFVWPTRYAYRDAVVGHDHILLRLDRLHADRTWQWTPEGWRPDFAPATLPANFFGQTKTALTSKSVLDRIYPSNQAVAVSCYREVAWDSQGHPVKWGLAPDPFSKFGGVATACTANEIQCIANDSKCNEMALLGKAAEHDRNGKVIGYVVSKP